MISVLMSEWCLVRSRCSSCTWSFRPWISVCSICRARGPLPREQHPRPAAPRAPRPARAPYPVGVLVVAAVLGEGGLAPLGQQDLGADVPVHGRLPHHGAGRHFITGGGAAGHHEGLGALPAGEPARRGRLRGRGAVGHATSSALQPLTPGDVSAPHVPPLAHGVGRRHLTVPQKPDFSGCCPDTHGLGTSCGRREPSTARSAFRREGCGSLLTASICCPCVSPHPAASPRCPGSAALPPSVLPCLAALPLPAPGPAAPRAQPPCGAEPGWGPGALPMGRQRPFVLSVRQRLAGPTLP